MKQAIVFFSVLILQFPLYGQAVFEVDADAKGVTMSQELIGAFFEDINFGADGGLYAELVQNRSFEYYTVPAYVTYQPLTAWSLVGSSGSMQIENTSPLNDNNTKYLRLTITGSGTENGIKNTGFNGIPVAAGEVYDFSVYVRSDSDFAEPLLVRLENAAGDMLGMDSIKGITSAWTKYTLEIPCSQTISAANLKLVTTGSGTLYFDMVSLFPRNTFNNRKNGLRKDLAQAVADLKPKFLRFPGGCITHGRGNDNAYRWKSTVGDVVERKPNWNLWGYQQTYGLGFFEFFLFSEDIGAKPLPVLPLGISCQFRNREIIPLDEMGPWIQDALVLICFMISEQT